MADVSWDPSGLFLLVQRNPREPPKARFGGLGHHSNIGGRRFPRTNTGTNQAKPEEGVQFGAHHRSGLGENSFGNGPEIDSPQRLNRSVLRDVSDPATRLPKSSEDIASPCLHFTQNPRIDGGNKITRRPVEDAKAVDEQKLGIGIDGHERQRLSTELVEDLRRLQGAEHVLTKSLPNWFPHPTIPVH